MPHPFDPGCSKQPFSTLAKNYPEGDVYPTGQFRLEWGPIFHRGRLDGSARVLVIGQDPAQHETVVRRILVGEAGRRVQGFLAKLGITNSYVMINTYLYSVYGTVKAATQKDPKLIAYRNKWIDAVLDKKKVEAVIALGTAAHAAWDAWKLTPKGQASTVAFAAITHPTQPESSSAHGGTTLAQATTTMLAGWNVALQALAPALAHRDVNVVLKLYGTAWADGDRVPIPEADMPAGLPAWMHENDGWAQRKGTDAKAKRRNITITVPTGTIA